MKKCPACGKEYSDETTKCEIDGQLLGSASVASNEQKTRSFGKAFMFGLGSTLAVLFFIGFLFYGSERKKQAESVFCRINMKGIRLCLMMYADDNGGKFPASFLSLSNFANPPPMRTFLCPNDKMKIPASTWSEFNAEKNCSFEFLAPTQLPKRGGTQQPLIYCPIHQRIIMSDGSYQRGFKKASKPVGQRR